MRCFLVDEGRLTAQEMPGLRNLLAALFRMEKSQTPSDVEQVLSVLMEWLQDPEQETLRRDFTVWLKRVFLPGRMPNVILDELTDLQEVRSMLAERVIEWTEEWKQQGEQIGLQRRLQQGEAAILSCYGRWNDASVLWRNPFANASRLRMRRPCCSGEIVS